MDLKNDNFMDGGNSIRVFSPFLTRLIAQKF